MKRHDIWQFFRKTSGKIAYNALCLRCSRNCKQSWQAKLIQCPRFRDGRTSNISEEK